MQEAIGFVQNFQEPIIEGMAFIEGLSDIVSYSEVQQVKQVHFELIQGSEKAHMERNERDKRVSCQHISILIKRSKPLKRELATIELVMPCELSELETSMRGKGQLRQAAVTQLPLMEQYSKYVENLIVKFW